MDGMILVGTIVVGVGLAMLAARISLQLIIQAMPERKKAG